MGVRVTLAQTLLPPGVQATHGSAASPAARLGLALQHASPIAAWSIRESAFQQTSDPAVLVRFVVTDGDRTLAAERVGRGQGHYWRLYGTDSCLPAIANHLDRDPVLMTVIYPDLPDWIREDPR